MDKGKYALIYIRKQDFKNSYIVSSNKNMALLSPDIDFNHFQNILFFPYNNYDINLIYMDLKEKTSIKFFTSPYKSTKYYLFNLITNEDLNNFFYNYGADSMFIRAISSSNNYIFNSTYFFDINEKYYLCIKKYYGYIWIFINIINN